MAYLVQEKRISTRAKTPISVCQNFDEANNLARILAHQANDNDIAYGVWSVAEGGEIPTARRENPALHTRLLAAWESRRKALPVYKHIPSQFS